MELREPPRTVDSRPGDATNRWLLIAVLALLLGLILWMMLAARSSTTGAATAERQREVAAKLQAAGAFDEAAGLYASYLEDGSVPSDKRARIAYTLGTNYMETGQFDKALRWFYEAETLGAGELGDELSSRIVHCLERLGRHHAAQAALQSHVQLEADPVQRSSEDPVVARIGQREIRRSQVDRALDGLPPEIAARFSTAEGKEELLRKYVADELLWQKAVKLEYDRDPEVERRQTEVLKQLAVTRFIEKEVLDQIIVDETDLANYFQANRERYQSQQAEGATEEITLDQVRPLVERDYQMVKMQSAYNDLIDSELSTQDVELFPERMVDDS
jgi:tetratricopeptide (TPR) repeat protein